MTMMVRPNHDRAFEGGGGDTGPGPTTGAGGAEEAVRCLSDDNICDVGGGGGTVVVKTTLTNYTAPLQQPFHISSAAATPTHTFKSPGAGAGGMMTASLGYPFTAAQWKELERQAMI